MYLCGLNIENLEQMKKMFLVGALALFGAVNAQTESGFKLGAHIGLPTGDHSEAYTFNLGADVAYTFEVAPNFQLGVTSGYSHYFGKNIEAFGVTLYEAKGKGIVPVAATAQYAFDGKIFVGADLGYAFSTQKDGGGSFYYQPKLGYTFNGKNDLYISYKGMSSDGYNLGSVNLGFAHKF